MMLSLAAFAGSAFAVGLFYAAWRTHQPTTGRLIKGFAVGLMLVSLWLWCLEHGPELGTCYAVVAFSLQAWTWIYLARQRIDKDIKRVVLPFESGMQWPGASHLTLRLLKAAACIFLCAISAMLLTVVWTTTLPMDKVDQIALGIYTMPVLWGAFVYWLCADNTEWRPVISVSVIGALSYLLIYSV